MSGTEKGYSKLQWFFLVIFIPVVFGVILFGVILSFLGIDIVDRAKQVGATVPFVSEFVTGEEEEEELVNSEQLQLTISEQQTQIEELQKELEQKNEEVTATQNEREQLEQRLAVREESTEESQQELAEIAKTYEAMSSKNAASIIAELPIEEALLHLSQVSTDSRAAILSKMESDKAADIISRLTNQ